MTATRVMISTALMLMIGAAFNCGGHEMPATIATPPPKAPPVVLQQVTPKANSPLVFPAQETGRQPRPDLPALAGKPKGRALVVHPKVAPDEVLTIEAKTVRIHFDRPMKGARGGKAAGRHIQISPSVVGQARWEGPTTLAFVADKYLDPAKRYSIKLVGVLGAGGEPLGDWQRTFRSNTAGVVAGKTLSHKPTLGAPRMVAVLPADDSTISHRQSMRVLFDQPLTLSQAQAQISLFNADGTLTALRFGWAPVGRFGGAAVNRKQVVVVTPRLPLTKGARYTVKVKNPADPAAKPVDHDLTVAQSFAFEDVRCGWYSRRSDICKRTSDGVLHTSIHDIHFLFNNPLKINTKQLRVHVRVSPFVRNLQIEEVGGWYKGRLVLRGDFQPSTSYKVTIAGLRDRFGGRQRGVLTQRVEMAALGASVTMPEGFVPLDEAHTEAFIISSRNVERAELLLWRIQDEDVGAFRAAMKKVNNHKLDNEDPSDRIVIDIHAKKNEMVHTEVDLRGKLKTDASYLVTVKLIRPAFGASPVVYKRHSAASRKPVALLRAGGANSVSAMVHSGVDSTLVYVTRRRSGKPVVGARVELVGGKAVAKSDKNGIAQLSVDTRKRGEQLLRMSVAGEQLLLPLGSRRTTADELFPALSGVALAGSQRAMVMSDRGIYRPGETIRLKGSVFDSQHGRLTPRAKKELRLVVVNTEDENVCDKRVVSTPLGGVAADCKLPPRAGMGLYRAQLYGASSDKPLAHRSLRVAAFVPPRFKVDVVASAPRSKAGAAVLRASVEGRYLFGAAMDGAPVEWSLRRRSASFPRGPFTAAGLQFEDQQSWWENEEEEDERWARTGRAKLDAAGVLKLAEPLNMGKQSSPMRFTLVADVHDDTQQHAAGRSSVVVHPVSRYVGIKIDERWVAAGDNVQASLGVMDTAGKPVVGVKAVAKLVAVNWKYQARRGPGGALTHEWRRHEREVGRCALTSGKRVGKCALKVPAGGDYRVVSEVDGGEGGTRWLWASYRRGRGAAKSQSPNKGKVVQLVADKGRYQAGDVAKVLARNPYPAATAILTVDMGGIVSRQVKQVTGPAAVFEVPIEARFAPHAYAVVTLLPIHAVGAQASSYRVGAVRLPVDMSAQRLTIALGSDRGDYRPGDTVEVTIAVSDQGKPETDAEVTLAIVDEGVLRLTNHHAPDPLTHLRPPLPLSFALRNSRAAMGDLFARSHVAGDGGSGDEDGAPDMRDDFVKTALWRPQLRTDAHGKAKVRFKLPDNLTEFRMMAVAVDRQGKGAVKEASFTVSKPVLIQPSFPRFAALGDDIQLSATVHNNQSKPFSGILNFAGNSMAVKVPARGRARVSAPFRPRKATAHHLTMELKDEAGQVMDTVKRRLLVQRPGMRLHPQLDGVFKGTQQVKLAIPTSVTFDEGEVLTLKIGPNLWPELGSRMEFLLKYPHGCVEQTTSSTLPLLAARDIMPRIGLDAHDDDFYRVRVMAGLKRLASMRTASGGLAYWPGGSEPNSYGTAYAMRAVVRAKQAGIEPPAGLIEGMTKYLLESIVSREVKPLVRVSMAQSLAELGALPAARADALYDLRGELDIFGNATLALALAKLPGQDDRVSELLAKVEKAFDDNGSRAAAPGKSAAGLWDGWHWWGSDRRTRAQAVMALTRLKPGSAKIRPLVRQLAQSKKGYVTQGTAFSLLALADHLMAHDAGSAEVAVTLDGSPLSGERKNATLTRYAIPLKQLVGKTVTLRLSADGDASVGFLIDARYRLPLSVAGAAAASKDGTAFRARQSSAAGVDVYRVITTPEGAAVDLSQIQLGQLLRVAVYAKLRHPAPRGEDEYLAITDPLPAGFEPVDTNLATSTSDSGPSERHPFAALLRQQSYRLSHLEQHDDKVQLYFDDVYGDRAAASYLVRATTRGDFIIPPTEAELMYVANSTSYGTPARVVIR